MLRESKYILQAHLKLVTNSFIFFSAFVVLIFSLYLLKPLNVPNDEYILDVSKGDSLYKIAYKLDSDNVISFPKLLRIFTYITGLDNNIHVGEYQFKPDDRVFDLLYKLNTGLVKQYSLKIAETDNSKILIDKLIAAEKLNTSIVSRSLMSLDQKILNNLITFLENEAQVKNIKTTNFIFESSLLSSLTSIEGIFYPDTYFYTKDTSEQDILNKSFLKLNRKFTELWHARDESIDKYLQTPYQALIVASILEREASDSHERKLVAGVIYNRIANNMPLQVDPTVIYALGENYSGNLTKVDLSIDSKYNTYIYKGLPPTPIGFVSLDSMIAALNPITSDYLYFVSMGNGKHSFSSSLEQHNKAVLKYQKNAEIKKQGQ